MPRAARSVGRRCEAPVVGKGITCWRCPEKARKATGLVHRLQRARGRDRVCQETAAQLRRIAHAPADPGQLREKGRFVGVGEKHDSGGAERAQSLHGTLHVEQPGGAPPSAVRQNLGAHSGGTQQPAVGLGSPQDESGDRAAERPDRRHCHDRVAQP